MEALKDAIQKVRLLAPKQHVLLISHMRANTSLVGHLIGSHEDISGYYEMHIGYYSWKSLINQKFLFHEQNRTEPVTDFYFDKVLHNEHFTSRDVLCRDNVKLLVALREPKATIKSIVKLYSAKNPEHPCASPKGAAQYYLDRVRYITDLILSLGNDQNYYYYDADDIIQHPKRVLGEMKEFLGIDRAFEATYRKFEKTGHRFAGDSSENIHAGVIVKKSPDTSVLDLDNELLMSCQDAYHLCREKLIQHSWKA